MSTQEQILQRLDKLDERVRGLEKYLWFAFGILGLLQFIAPYISRLVGVK